MHAQQNALPPRREREREGNPAVCDLVDGPEDVPPCPERRMDAAGATLRHPEKSNSGGREDEEALGGGGGAWGDVGLGLKPCP